MEIKPIAVGVLNDYIGSILARDGILSRIRVVGEIANLTNHSAGHTYFSLKDDNSTIKCFFPEYAKKDFDLELEDGKKVIVDGSISVFKRGGYYSITVKNIEIEGIGDVNRQFEKIKKKLMKEGLFDSIHKKKLPKYPTKIAIVTSDTGAAIEDILKTLRERNQMTDVFVFPVLVQGENAPKDISYGINYINDNYSKEIDLMIVGRGGGSAEDLWAFNEEIVARAIFDSKIPIISAVGHETDITIADMVADFRAATPTAAAIIAVRSKTELKQNLENLQKRINNSLENYIDKGRLRLNVIKEKIRGLNPQNVINRGYGAILDKDGNLITSISNLKEKDMISILMKGAELEVEIKNIKFK